MIISTNSDDEIDKIIGRGPFFRAQISKQRDVMRESIATGFALAANQAGKSAGQRLEILRML